MAFHICNQAPAHAFVAGVGVCGETIHVAIGKHRNWSFPGTLSAGDTTMHICHDGGVRVVKGPFDVLVEKKGCKYWWHYVKRGEPIPDKALVAIVNQFHGPVHIGRITDNGAQAVGEVAKGVCTAPFKGQVKRRENFDVLLFQFDKTEEQQSKSNVKPSSAPEPEK